MSNVGEASKKRHSFSLLTRRDPAPSTEPSLDDTEPANGRFIPESKRGWKYDIPSAFAPSANLGSSRAGPSSATLHPSVSQARKSAEAASNTRPKGSGPPDGLLDVSTADGTSRAALSAPVSPKRRSFVGAAAAADVLSSDSSSSEDDLDPSSPGLRPQDPLEDEEVVSRAIGAETNAKRHPDDLVYPDLYPWKPSLKNPKAKYMHPAHRNPTAKQAFYDTHFGSSSNYRGLLPASGSLLNLSSTKMDARRRSSDKGDTSNGSASNGADVDAHASMLYATVKKPFSSASKFIKARRKSFGAGSSLSISKVDNGSVEQAQETPPQRAHPVPLYRQGEDSSAAERSGFSYGLSMEDAAQVEAVVSRHASNEDVTTPVRLDEHLPPPASQEATSSRWREAMNSAWGFLPSFDFFASSSAATDYDQDIKAIPSGNMLEPELIPTIKKDPGSPDYYKNLTGNVVILGGYRGSVLRDAETNMMMWIPIKVGVGLRRPTLELGLSTEAEEKSEELVYSSEPCMSIGKLVDMGKRLEERIAGRRHAKVHAWGYDWRLSLARSSKRLTAFLEQLYETSGETPSHRRGAKVVAHSMGGLVALHALATCSNPRIFEGLVFASTPFRGTPNILGPFRFGDAALFNDTICSPRATFSFRSSFYLLPPDGRCFEVPVGEPDQDEEDLTEQQKKQRFKDVDFTDPNVWNELGLSPCLQLGRRQQLIALARKNGEQKTRESLSIDTASDAELEKAAQVSSPTSGNPDIASPDGENGLSMGVVEGLTDNVNADPSAAELPADSEEQRALQPSNRQGAERNVPSSPASDPAFDTLDYATQSWLYLDRTLSEVRDFWRDIEEGFSPAKHANNDYPPLMLLTSGRTPCVRGALVGVDSYNHSKSEEEAEGWKDDVRAGDYSRMTYGAGDGVITRRSATSLPGSWSKILVKREEAETLPNELWGKGPPFKKRAKGLKLDRYKMHFDGPGIVESSHRHVTLLSDVDGIGKCLEAVRRANLVRGRVALSQENHQGPRGT